MQELRNTNRGGDLAVATNLGTQRTQPQWSQHGGVDEEQVMTSSVHQANCRPGLPTHARTHREHSRLQADAEQAHENQRQQGIHRNTDEGGGNSPQHGAAQRWPEIRGG